MTNNFTQYSAKICYERIKELVYVKTKKEEEKKVF